MWVYLKMTEKGGLVLPPEALKALGGAESAAVERGRAGAVVLKPAGPDTPGAVPVSGAGVLTLPLDALEAMKKWPAWDGIDGWDGCNLEINADEEGRRLILFFAADSGTKALRRRIAELGWTEDDIAGFIGGVRTEIREEKQEAAREAARAGQRKAV